MRSLFAVDICVDIDTGAIRTLMELLDLDGDAVRDLVEGIVQDALPKDLGGDDPLGLVGQGVLREEVRPFLGVLDQKRQDIGLCERK